MSTKVIRRVSRLFAAMSVALLPLASQLQIVSASSAGALFALQFNTVAKVDTSTGSLTPFASLPPPPPGQLNPSFNGFADDPVGHRLFTTRSSISSDFSAQFYNLVTVDTQTGATSVSGNMPLGAPELVFDTSSGSLFGITNMCCPFQLVRIDPTTGAQTLVANLPGVQESRMAIDPSKHAIYMISENFVLGQFQPVLNIVTVNDVTGVISQSPTLTIGAFDLVFDASSATLFGKSFCCPSNLLTIDPVSGAESMLSTSDLGFGAGFAIDSASHTIYTAQDVQGAFSFNQFLQTVNDQTGALSVSTTPFPSPPFVVDLAFEGVAITPESIKVDVTAALATGAISNAGVASSLLAELSQAAAARALGQCATAANIYGAFIHEVTALSGRAIAAATASQLIGEAKFLIANCP